MNSVRDWLFEAGAAPESIVDLREEASPRHVRYLDLLNATQANGDTFPDAVIESAGVPHVYVVQHDTLGASPANKGSLARLLRILACRADARFLAVIEPGRVVVYPIVMDAVVPAPMLSDTSGNQYSKLRSLLGGNTGKGIAVRRSKKAAAQWLDDLLFRLLTDAARGIQRAVPDLTIQQVLALVGRALFFRFLVDRNIVHDDNLPQISHRAADLDAVFENLGTLLDTCQWLDKTFNGDLLSLGDSGYGSDRYNDLQRIVASGSQEVCWHLTNIQRKAVGGQLPLDWGGIYFKHVPVDVLSQVYEDFAHQFVPQLAKSTSIHFTPRKLAEIVVDGAFSALRSSKADCARVLDPAVGGGVFLVLAFRRLIVERWKATGHRPSRAEIRRILMDQLVGMDVNRDALNVTALSLYLCALELDPDPSPLSDLKFEKLIGSILHPVDETALSQVSVEPDQPLNSRLGSLSDQILSKHAGRYDLVVGNPPWSSFKGKLANALNHTLRKMLAQRTGHRHPTHAAAVASYGPPDVAFLLAAASWAKPGGAIGFAIHARFFFQSTLFELRRHVFDTLRVTGVMNFAALRQDSLLWPNNDAQFALMVAVNETPGPLDSFYFISPRHEPRLSEIGAFRVDPGSAIPVPLHDMSSDAHAFKALYKGGRLGLDLLKRMSGKSTLAVGRQVAKHGLRFRSGYQSGKPERQTQDASHLTGLLDAQLDMAFVAAPGHRTSGKSDEFFGLPKLQRARKPGIYRGPLLLLRESPRAKRTLRGALFADQDVAYRESFIGLSAHGKPEAAGLIDLIYVTSYSDLFLYHQLLTSPKFGVERDSSLQEDLLAFPLLKEECLDSQQRNAVRDIAAKLRKGRIDWDELDRVVFDLHGLSDADTQLVRDTLAMELPFSDVSKKASAATDPSIRKQFVETVCQMIEPFVDPHHSGVGELEAKPIDGWVFVEIGAPTNSGQTVIGRQALADLIDFAESYWVTRVKVKLEDRVIIGLLDQRRYWTQTEARSLALDWLQSDASENSNLQHDAGHIGTSPL